MMNDMLPSDLNLLLPEDSTMDEIRSSNHKERIRGLEKNSAFIVANILAHLNFERIQSMNNVDTRSKFSKFIELCEQAMAQNHDFTVSLNP